MEQESVGQVASPPKPLHRPASVVPTMHRNPRCLACPAVLQMAHHPTAWESSSRRPASTGHSNQSAGWRPPLIRPPSTPRPISATGRWAVSASTCAGRADEPATCMALHAQPSNALHRIRRPLQSAAQRQMNGLRLDSNAGTGGWDVDKPTSQPYQHPCRSRHPGPSLVTCNPSTSNHPLVTLRCCRHPLIASRGYRCANCDMFPGCESYR